jgi:hypothetical protein
MRLKMRAESLDECLELLKAARLDDILLSLNKLSGQLETEYRVVPGDKKAGPVSFAHGLLVRSEGVQELILESRLTISGSGGDQKIVLTPPKDDFSRYHQNGARRALEASLAKRKERPCTEAEKEAFRLAAAKLAQRGIISHENQALFQDFINGKLLHFVE